MTTPAHQAAARIREALEAFELAMGASQGIPAREVLIRACSPDSLRALLAERDELAKDAARLDFLDTINARKNERNGTIYGWWLNENHNRIALEDHDHRKLSSREAIDAAQAALTNKD